MRSRDISLAVAHAWEQLSRSSQRIILYVVCALSPVHESEKYILLQSPRIANIDVERASERGQRSAGTLLSRPDTHPMIVVPTLLGMLLRLRRGAMKDGEIMPAHHSQDPRLPCRLVVELTAACFERFLFAAPFRGRI
jgi:hypothetical protein